MSQAYQQSTLSVTPRKEFPVRTCVGCRCRTNQSQLIRVVFRLDSQSGFNRLVVSAGKRLPGRGVYLHPVAACLELAQHRNALGRSLKVTGPVDLTPVREFLAAVDMQS